MAPTLPGGFFTTEPPELTCTQFISTTVRYCVYILIFCSQTDSDEDGESHVSPSTKFEALNTWRFLNC